MELYNWDEMEKETMNDKTSRQYVSGKKAMLARLFSKRVRWSRPTNMKASRLATSWRAHFSFAWKAKR